MFAKSAEFYDAMYATFKDYKAESAELAALLRRLNPRCALVLDVACGTGEHLHHLTMTHGFEVAGLDLDQGLLDVARQKTPQARLLCADMLSFDLPDRFDAILCLFSSIAYVKSLDAVERVFRRFRSHLRPDGVVVVEPWFEPGQLNPQFVMRQEFVVGGMNVERQGHTDVVDRLSIVHFDYRIVERGEERTEAESHELGLFTRGEMLAAFASADLAAEYDPAGLTGRGLYIARAER